MLAALKQLPADCSYVSLKSPVGPLWLVASAKGLHALLMKPDLEEHDCRQMIVGLKKDPEHPILKRTVKQLTEYFSGQRRQFDIPLVPVGTDFQKQVWSELRKIPYGQTISYQEQAKRIGDAKKARAVGTANSRNPLSIIVPCHRVVASSGALSGFGGGVKNKQFLINLESGSA